MMRLSALSEEERAAIHACDTLPFDETLTQRTDINLDSTLYALTNRLCQHMRATLGLSVQATGCQAYAPANWSSDQPPAIEITAPLAAIWVHLRYGGRVPDSAGELRGISSMAISPVWQQPLLLLIKRALAETVINQGQSACWPQAVQITLQVGTLCGTINIALNCVAGNEDAGDFVTAVKWARHQLHVMRADHKSMPATTMYMHKP